MHYSECRGQHTNCDICDGIRHDPNVGWGGFTDHYAKRHFKTVEEQNEYYKNNPDPERKDWKDR